MYECNHGALGGQDSEVVVTGASAGIGAAIAVTLANAGMNVVGLARRVERVDELKSQVKQKGSIVSVKCDVAKPDEIAKAFKWIEDNRGGTDVLVNNAGVFYRGHITDLESKAMKEEDIISTIDINVKGLILCNRHAVSSMKKRNFNGHIININSIAGHYIPLASEFNVYSSSKYAVTAFTSALLNELADCKSLIKVTSVSPGLVNTDMAADGVKFVDYKPLEAQDIADLVIYVVSTPPLVNISEITVRPVSEKAM